LLLFGLGLNPEFIGFRIHFGLFAREMFRFRPSYFPATYRSPYPGIKEIIPAAAEKIIELVKDKKISKKRASSHKFLILTALSS